MSIFDVKHQVAAQRLLQHAWVSSRLPHAYLFFGPDGVGKQMLAQSLAQLLLCPQSAEVEVSPEDLPHLGVPKARVACGECSECLTVSAQTHPDLHIVHRRLGKFHPDSEVRKRKAIDLGVDVIRHFLIDKVGATPLQGRAKVFIVLEADRITPAAQNAMLKTLEEPPGPTFLILLAESLDRLLETTVSRCQAVPFSPLPRGFIADQLRRTHADLPADRIAWYASFAEGSLGRAYQGVEAGWYELSVRVGGALADLPQRSPAMNYAPWSEQAKALAGHYKKHDEDISETEAQRRAFKAILTLGASFIADVARHGSGACDGIVNRAQSDEIKRCAANVSPTSAADIITRIVSAQAQLDINANVQLCIETLLDDITAIAAGKGDPIVTLPRR